MTINAPEKQKAKVTVEEITNKESPKGVVRSLENCEDREVVLVQVQPIPLSGRCARVAGTLASGILRTESIVPFM